MKLSTRVAVTLLLSLMGSSRLYAQLSGTITVPSPTYPDLTTAITALNTQGVGTGGVAINITAGNAQTAPNGGYVLGSTTLNGSVSSAKTITIHGNGNTVNAYTGTGYTDGFFKILGTDYVTIDGLSFTESSANSSATTQMEWGVALLKLNGTAPYDGCQHNVVTGCSFAMGTAALSSAIYVNNHIATDTTTLSAAGAVAADAQHNNTFIGNTISNSQRGIFLRGFNNAPTLYDQNATVVNNNITFGGNAVASYGVYAVNDSIITLSQNTFTSPSTHSANQYGVQLAGGSGNVTATQNSFSLNGTGTFTAGFYNTGWKDSNATFAFTNNRFVNWNLPATSSSTTYCLYNTNYFNTVLITGDTIRNVSVTGGFFGLNNSGSITTHNIMSGNVIDNVTKGAVSLTLNLLYTYVTGSGQINVENNMIRNVTAAIASTAYAINVSPGGTNYVIAIKNNKIDAFDITGSTIYGIYASSTTTAGTGSGAEIAYDTVSNINSLNAVTGIFNAYASPLIHHNVIANLSTSGNTGSITGFYNSDGYTQFYNNTITGLSANGTGGSLTGVYFNSGRDSAQVYNNTIADFTVGNAFNTANTSSLVGMYFNGLLMNVKIKYNVYHNTIRLAPVSTGTNFGAVGIQYGNTATSFDLRNNIINVNVMPAGTGITAAVLRTAGTAGVIPANFALTSGGNIYYVPSAANAYLYAEGGTLPLVNAFNIGNDPNFNAACGAYKSFMGADLSSTTENNLSAGTLVHTYVPSGTSLAKKAGVPTSMNVDYAGVTRTTPADAGALQFTATAADVTGPQITYTTLPVISYCTAAPSLLANITDANGVNTTTGTAPRLYYRKSSENNAFGTYPANNNSSFNGWKYVEATGTAPNFTFTPNYSLLTTSVAVGDSIVYFVVAQDNATTPHVSNNRMAFTASFCPSSVNLSAASAIAASPVCNGYKILAVPAFTATASPASLCNGDNTTISLSPAPGGLSVIWQNDNNTGTFAPIPGATSNAYTTPALTATNNYNALLQCNSTTVATAATAAVTVNTPLITGTTPNQHCGTGTVLLSATASSGATVNWYTVATGGNPVATGTSFTTPIIGATTTYYASATNGTTAKHVGKVFSVGQDGSSVAAAGLIFNAAIPFTLQSVSVYPVGSGSGTIIINLLDAANNVLQADTATLTGTTTPGIKTSVPLNFAVPAGNGLQLKLISKTGSITGLLRDYALASGVAFPYTIPGVVSINNGTTAGQYCYFYDWIVGVNCEGPRVPVVATVNNNAPAFSVNAAQTVCNNGIATMQVSSPLANYTNYTWSPATNLYTDAAATIPYTGTSASIVYAKTATAGSTIYTATASNSITGCTGTDSGKVWVQPATAAVSVTPDTICINGIARMALVPGTGYAPNSIQWNNSATGSGYLPIVGATDTVYSTITTGTTFYKAILKNSANAVCLQPYDSVIVSNPQVTATTPGTHCGPGPVVLHATGSANTILNWYDSLTGGSLLNTGASFTTPTIFSNTTYYVSAQSGSGDGYIGKMATNGTSGSNMAAGLTFNAAVPFVLKSVALYPIGSTTVTFPVSLKNAAGTVLQTTNVTVTGSAAPGVKTRVALNFNVPAGNGLQLVLGSSPAGVTLNYDGSANASSISYPYSIAGIASVVSTNGATPQTNAYYYFYDWLVSAACQTVRTPVPATVTPSPAITVTPANPAICFGDTATLVASSSNAGYTYHWYPAGLTGNTISVSPISTLDYHIIATDSSAGPNFGCASYDTVVVTVYPAPPVPVISLNGFVLSTGPYAAYQWNLDGQTIPGATSVTWTALANGVYTVSITDVNGCKSTSAPVTVTGVSVGNVAAGNKDIYLYPNPATTTVWVKVAEKVNLELYTAEGRLIMHAANATSLDISALANGMYMIRVTDMDGRVLKNQRLVKTEK